MVTQIKVFTNYPKDLLKEIHKETQEKDYIKSEYKKGTLIIAGDKYDPRYQFETATIFNRLGVL